MVTRMSKEKSARGLPEFSNEIMRIYFNNNLYGKKKRSKKAACLLGH